MVNESGTVRNIGILIFPDVELLDFCGPYEAFTAASRDGEPYFNTFTVAEQAGPVASKAGLKFIPDYTFENAPKIDGPSTMPASSSPITDG